MSGFVATMSWIALAYQLYYLRQFFQWGFEYDRVKQWIELSGHFLVVILITWQFARLRQLRREQLLLVNPDADYSGLAKAFHGWIVSLVISSILLTGHSLVSYYETYVGFPQWTAASRVDSLKSSLRDPEVDNFSFQAREGSYDPQAGWTESSIFAKEIVTKKVYLSEQVLLDVQDIQSMTRGVDENGGATLCFHLNAAAGAKLKNATEAMIGRSMALILNGKVLTLPKVSSAFSRDLQVTGLESEEVDRIIDAFYRYSEARR